MTEDVLEIAFTRRSLRALDGLVEQLRAAGLKWLELHDVAGHIAAVTEWLGHRDLLELCSRTGWPMPTSSGVDHTTPAALAVTRAKQRLEKAMLADHRGGTSANEVAARASSVHSRPIALDILAAERLLADAVTALTPWFERDVPLHLFPGPADRRRTLELSALWKVEGEGVDQAVRRELLEGVDEALAALGLALRDLETKAACDSAALLPGDHAVVELYRAQEGAKAL
ncbi:hypothetical protein ACFY4B_27220 [Kitasatospora sp. NPDC001261]|uniref:hypothetical protein n=1 Tax=Kitasatospora sp. NPDC001261 TaxID=3364012 RepID=UPI00369E5A15